jgi:Protein of unknown function (DUF3768)
MSMEGAPNPSLADRNDTFRQRCMPYLTPGAIALPDIHGLVQAVRDFNDFNPDNDPHGEHDFGALEWYGDTTYWKIDYYDQQLQYWYDPREPDCQRLLTILLASEY